MYKKKSFQPRLARMFLFNRPVNQKQTSFYAFFEEASGHEFISPLKLGLLNFTEENFLMKSLFFGENFIFN